MHLPTRLRPLVLLTLVAGLAPGNGCRPRPPVRAPAPRVIAASPTPADAGRADVAGPAVTACTDAIQVAFQHEPHYPQLEGLVPEDKQCVQAPDGFWVSAVRNRPPEASGPEGAPNLAVTLAHVRPDGSVHLAVVPNGNGNDGAHSCNGGGHSIQVQLIGHLDGDARSDVLATEGGNEGAGDPMHARGWVYTTDETGAVIVHPDVGDLDVASVIDYDQDGRMDLVVSDPFVDTMHHEDARGPAMLQHQLADGSFSEDDAVALRFARESCPGGPPPLARVEVDLHSIACARLWGLDPAALAARITRWARRQPTGGEDYGNDRPGTDPDLMRAYANAVPLLDPRRMSDGGVAPDAGVRAR